MNNRGFSLIEVMVVAGILGGLAVVGMKLTENTTSAINFMKSRNVEESVYRNIEMLLTNKKSCTLTLEGIDADGGEIQEIKNSNDKVIYTVGDKIEGNMLKITSIKLENNDIAADKTRGTAFLAINVDRLKSGFGATNSVRKFLIQATNDIDGKILECFSDNSQIILTSKSEMCESLGGAFDLENSSCTLSPVAGGTGTEAASQDYITAQMNALRVEFDQKLLAVQSGVEIPTTPLDLLIPQASCPGSSVRFKYASQSEPCDKELQYRICKDGKWGSWSGSYSHSTCPAN